MYQFSPATRQFYVLGIHPRIPGDAFEVSQELHSNFLAAQSRGEFSTIRAGKLVRIDPPAQEAAALETAARRRREILLSSSDWTQLSDAPLDKKQRDAWKKYRQALRDVTQQKAFPTAIDWPKHPQ